MASNSASSKRLVRWEVISRANPNVALLRAFYRDILLRYFLPGEIEELELFEASILADDASPPTLCRWAAVVAVSCDSDDEPVVAAGGVVEYYYNSQCALLPYIAVCADFRGMGLAKVLIQQALGHINTLIATEPKTFRSLQALFLEVLQVCDEDEEARQASGFDAATRQRIWTSLGFAPIEGINLVHPGRLKGHRYNLAVFAGMAATTDARLTSIPIDVVVAFIKDEFKGILLDEGIESEEEVDTMIEAVYSTAAGRTALPISSKWWR